MPERFHIPGVSIQKTGSPKRSITAVPTSMAVMIGSFPKGPSFSPTRLQSLQECDRRFGGLKNDRLPSLVASQFFNNGGKDIWVISTGSELTKRATPLLKGLSVLPQIPSFHMLLIPETSQLSVREAARVYLNVIPIVEKHQTIYFLDPPQSDPGLKGVQGLMRWVWAQHGIHHQNVVLYFPLVQVRSVSNPKRRVTLPTSGTMAGVYARFDQMHGVWKAPAGTEAKLQGVVGLEPQLTSKDLNLLASVNVNPLQPRTSSTYIAWGARTLASNPEWKYVPVRRMALFLKQSVQQGLQWAVFEPNDEPLWTQIRVMVSEFLESLFRQGAFQGARSRHAYFVKCGRETTTVADQKAGIVNVIIGFAPLKPAEFIVIYIIQQTQES